MKYDFILFEHLYSVENHYKDLCILAQMLKKAGYKVAILDAFKERDLCKTEEIPHISLQLSCPDKFRKASPYQLRQSSIMSLYDRLRKDIYMYRIIRRLSGKAFNIYAGSLTLASPIFFMKAFDKDTRYFMWALRSSHMLGWKKSHGSMLYSWISKELYQNIHRHENLNLIISNQMILREFEEKVGVERRRLILRPERVIENKQYMAGKGQKEQSLNILFIGTLRPFKNVEFCLKALERLNDQRIHYTIAGRCKTDREYNKMINSLSAKLPNVTRIDRYISDEEYEQLMSDCDFLILCDKKQASCASNGTMTEALLHGKPIIAPDFNPFKEEVEEHQVGYLYEYGNVDSLCDIILRALDSGQDFFRDKIDAYQNQYLSDNVVSFLKRQLEDGKAY